MDAGILSKYEYAVSITLLCNEETLQLSLTLLDLALGLRAAKSHIRQFAFNQFSAEGPYGLPGVPQKQIGFFVSTGYNLTGGLRQKSIRKIKASERLF